MAAVTTQVHSTVSFGPFSLAASERRLTKEGVPVELGARALDILIALVSKPNEIVSKKELLAQVWPDAVVEEGSLRFHIVGLRKALGDGRDGARYITTAPGRGYCFVAPLAHSTGRNDGPSEAASFPHANLPGRLSRIVGREDDVLKLSAQLTTTRFVSIVGAGGVGKTTVAVAVGHDLLESFAGVALFVDLGMLNDPNLVATAVASMLGLSVQSSDATPSLIAYLRDKRILLILDTCEHLVDAVASLAATIIKAVPQAHILATSREPLRADGEHVYRLDALAFPPDDSSLTAEAIHRYPAAQLFVERAVASGARLDVSDAEAPIIASICRRLDGVALAIELAARRVESHGLQQTAALLDQRLTLLWVGSRTAPPRQKTLQATLDWSYELLSELERTVLRRLAIFVGHFTLDAALDVVASPALDQSVVFGAVDSLVAKSMVATRPIGAMMRYRLLDTTRAYALETKMDGAELTDLAIRHAAYYRRWLDQSGAEWPTLSTGTERAPHFAGINNVRAALEWCFGPNGNVEIGVGLAVAAAPVFLAMSLLPECHRWSERTILALDDAARGGREEMHLQAALGVSLMFMQGGRDAAREALQRSYAIADERGDALDQLRLLGPLNMFHRRTGDFRTALQYARRCSAIAGAIEDPVAIALAHCILGVSLQASGNLAEARTELEAAMQRGPQRTTTIYLGFEGRILAGAILARNLWLQGYPDQAMTLARETVEEAMTMNHSLTLAIALIWAITVFLWAGDLRTAQTYIDLLASLAESHSLAPYRSVARGFTGDMAIRQDDSKGGVESLQSALQQLHAMPYELLTTEFDLSLVRGLFARGRFAEATALIDETSERIQTNGDPCYLPELLRVKGNVLLSMLQPDADDAEACFKRSLELSRQQGARAWELRTTIDLAGLWLTQGKTDNARSLLQAAVEQFTEGLETADLKAAERLLVELG